MCALIDCNQSTEMPMLKSTRSFGTSVIKRIFLSFFLFIMPWLAFLSFAT